MDAKPYAIISLSAASAIATAVSIAAAAEAAELKRMPATVTPAALAFPGLLGPDLLAVVGTVPSCRIVTVDGGAELLREFRSSAQRSASEGDSQQVSRAANGSTPTIGSTTERVEQPANRKPVERVSIGAIRLLTLVESAARTSP